MNFNIYLEAKRKYDALEQEFDQLEQEATSLHSPTLSHTKASNTGMYADHMADYMARREDIQRRAWAAKAEQVDAFIKICEMIDKVNDSILRQLLNARYLLGYNSKEAAEFIGYSTGQYYRLKKRAETLLEEIARQEEGNAQ